MVVWCKQFIPALKDIETPDIARVRAKVKLALVAAKSAVSDTAHQVGRLGHGLCVGRQQTSNEGAPG